MKTQRIAPLVVIRYGIAVALMAAALLLFPALGVLADTYEVDRTDDNAGATACTGASNDCSLRGAVTRANLNPGFDRIVVGARTFDLTILGQEDDNKQGDLDIQASGGSLRIEGAGADETIIRGGRWTYGTVAGIDRVFHIDPDATGGIRVAISGVSVQYGYGGNNGGGIHIMGDNLVEVTDSVIMSNTVGVVSALGGGGGVYNREGTLLLTNSDVVSNTARAGVVGPVVLGGGIFIEETATLTATGCTVSGNEVRVIDGPDSEAAGGGLGTLGGAVYVHGSTLSRNRATGGTTGSVGLGGGIVNAAGGLMVIDQDSVVSNNDADLQGGGMANIDSTARIDGSAFVENRATGGSDGEASSGGGVFNLVGEVEIISGTVESNEAVTLETPDEFGEGGGIAASGGTVEVVDSSIQSNVADSSCGGILNGDNSTLSVDGSYLGINVSGHSGGGLCNYQSRAIMTDTTVTLNMADSVGGGITGMESELSLTRCWVSGNKALDGDGGGIYDALGRVNIVDSTLYANRSYRSGGGLWEHGGEVTITGSTLMDNVAEDAPTGGATDNHGGGMFLRIGVAHLVNSTLSGNRANEMGGGIYAEDSTLTLSNSTVARNVADDDDDGNGNGGGIFDGVSNPAIVNTIIAGNTDRGGEAPDCGGHGLLAYGDNIIQDRTGCSKAGGSGTIWVANPLLDTLGDNGGPTDTHALRAGSPAIDKVTNNCRTYQAVVLTADQRGVSRPIGAACDIGAYEAALVYLPLVVRNWQP